MARDLSGLGLLVIQIDGIHMDQDMTLVAAIGVDANGDKGWSRAPRKTQRPCGR
jgi:putative transposase